MSCPRALLPTLVLAFLAVRSASAKDLPNFDALAPTPLSVRADAVRRSAAQRASPGAPVHMEDRLGVPSFLWSALPSGRGGRQPLAAGVTPEAAAKHHLLDYVSLYGLTDEDVAAATVSNVHDTGMGVIVVSLRRQLDGIEVFRDELRVAMDRQLEPLAFAGYLPPATLPVDDKGFNLSASQAVVLALCDFDESAPDAAFLSAVGETPGGYVLVGSVPAERANPVREGLLEPARVKKVFFHLPEKLEPAYYLEMNVGAGDGTGSVAYAYVLSAVDGRLLFRKNLTQSDSFSYRVWADTSSLKAPLDGPQGTAGTPHPTGLPDGFQAPFVAPGLFALTCGPISTCDPWLAPGATETTGNNAEAYADLLAPDGFSAGDLRADVTSPSVFDRTFDVTKFPQVSADQRKAAIVQLFYDVNFFHDWYYDIGFDERSGNAQTSNYGRGGLENDSLKAEAQDFEDRNNANMTTPADGARPRVQMYLWTGRGSQPAPDRDGALDNLIVAHEWGHLISNRLIGNASGLATNMSNGLGEGWADFHALLLAVKGEDAAVSANAGYSGVYALAGYVTIGGFSTSQLNNGFYFGVRRVPYSTDFAKDPLTFKHIANGTPLPTTAPVAPGISGPNAEVHNTGEVWCTMLWECYASLLTDTARLSFDAARERMRRYLVAAYKITPSNPTLLEARDALLVSALASDRADYLLFARAFARRGAGVGAVAPDRYSETNQGVVESFTATGNELAFVSVSLDDDVLSCDRDGVLDGGETGTLTLVLKNVGTGNLVATSATVSSSNPAVSFPAGATVSFPASQPFQATLASLPVALGPVSGIQILDFSAAFRDAGGTLSGEKSVGWSVRANTTERAAQSATDDVETASTRWTPGRDGALDLSTPWRRVEIGPLDHRWAAPSAPGRSDQYLVSPPLAVAATGSFGFNFRSRFSFETQLNPTVIYWDGGVLELSSDGGVTWTDIGASATPGYQGVLTTDSNNPLGNRQAFCGDSPDYPGMTTVTVALGTAYQGKSVRLRFRVGSDDAVGSPGWEIDDIAFSNITNTPFATLVAQEPCVAKGPPFVPSRVLPGLGKSPTPVKKP